MFEVKLTDKTKYIRTEDTEYHAKAVIIASGASSKALPAQNADEFKGRGVHYCATCDGSMYEDRKIIAIGGGDAAVEEAIYLTKFAFHVTFIHRSQFRASQSAMEKLRSNSKIDIITDSRVTKVNGMDYALTSVEIENLKTGQTYEYPAEGAFVCIGVEPASQLYRGRLTNRAI